VNRLRLLAVQLELNPKRLFLIDSLGAFLSSFLLGAMLTRFENIFGMPQRTLYFLSFIAFTYVLYSLCCYFFGSRNWQPYLKVIAIANLVYCCLTIALVFLNFSSLTVLGLTYFFAELLIIGGLATVELMTISISGTEEVDDKYTI
jgi:hypothetical protein